MQLDRYTLFHLSQKLNRAFARRARRKRTERFLGLMRLRSGQRIVDLGGLPETWTEIAVPLDVTLVNLPGKLPATVPTETTHRFTLVEGDACDLKHFESNSFDLCFSNSVIEHVGDSSRIEAFADEVQRLAPRYWVQTPSIYFPIEAHTNIPLWFFIPMSVRERLFLRRWRKTLPAWTRSVEGTTVLHLSTLRRLFPEASVYVERFWGLPKSYSMYRS